MGYRIGVDLGGTNMAAGILDESCHMICKKSIRTRKHASPEQVAADMAKLVWSLLEETGIEKEQVELLGIGIPGSVTKDGVVEDANNIGFYQVPFGEMMKNRTGFEVRLVNDARAAAAGEYFVGAGKGCTTFQMLTIGTGIGGAYIVDGKAIVGCNGAAGELGHMVIEKYGTLCSCGRRGCFEAYASASALQRQIKRAALREKSSLLWQHCGGNSSQLNAKMLFECVEQGDEVSQKLFAKYIEYLAEGVANVINLLQPEVLCIGGGMSEQKEKLLEPLRAAVAEKIYSKHSEVQTKIVAAELGNDAGIVGAAFPAEEK